MRRPLRLTSGLWLVLAAPLGACGGGGGRGPDSPSQVPALALDQVLPASAQLAGGTAVNLVGSGFASAVPPLFVHLGTRVVVPSLANDTLLHVTVPAGDAPGAVDVRLVTGEGVLAIPGGLTYAPPPAPAPRLTFAPSVGSFAANLGGTRVDLTLHSFVPLVAPTITFGGFPVTNLAVLTTTQVRVEVPAGLPTGQFVAIVLSEGSSQALALDFWSQGALPAGSLTINEFLANPGALDTNRDGTLSSSGDEFVELVNGTGAPVDLTGWTLHDSTTQRHLFPNPTTVPARGSIVIFGSGNPTFFAPRHASGHAQLASTGDLGLNNSADAITLRDPSAAVAAQVLYLGADVTAARSRNALTDGGALPVPAASVDYALHDTLPGAAGAASPGIKANGAPFP